MTTTLGSALGGWAAIAPQPTYGANVVTPTRQINIKTGSWTFDPHFVQGTDYLVGGRSIDIGSAHVATYLDAKGTISGDFLNTGMALMLATAFGSSATLTEFGTTTAYRLGGASGLSYGTPDSLNGGPSGCCFDMQAADPTADGTVNPYTFHSCMITKATWTFDRTGLVEWSYDFDAQYVENGTTALISTPTFATTPIPFSMNSSSSFCKIGALGSEALVSGFRKTTITLERKLATDRIYQGYQYKQLPVTNGYSSLTASIDADFTPDAKTALYDQFLANTPFSVVQTSVGAPIGSSGVKDTFSLNPTNCFVQSGGEPTLASPDLIKSTVNLMGTINAANTSALLGSLFTADTGW